MVEKTEQTIVISQSRSSVSDNRIGSKGGLGRIVSEGILAKIIAPGVINMAKIRGFDATYMLASRGTKCLF